MPDAEGMQITIDGRAVEARKGEYVIAAAERVGIYIPRFCYHPRMRSVGMCRMCLVNIDAGRGPALTAACIAECSPGMVVDTRAPEVRKAQDGVLEFLLINHPLDCPVCDKGGECPLQDQTLHFGPGETRFVEEKRHFEKPIPVSSLVLLDRERCILCDRCTRFAKEVAGDPLIHFVDRGAQTEVNTFPDHPFASYFSGNTVQICPVGALTAAPYRFRARPWDLEQVASTCTTCAVGCRVVVQSSSNALTRYLGIDSDPVNQSWLCDRGRFDFEAVNSPDRLVAPRARRGTGDLSECTWGEALQEAAAGIANVRTVHGPEAIAVLGGARLANEDAYAWAKLAKGVLATDNVDAQLADGLPADLVVGLPPATIDDAVTAAALIVLAPDPKEELPVLYLRLRDAAQRGLPIIEVSPRSTSMTPLARATLLYRPGEAAAVLRALLAPGDPASGDPGTDVGGVASSALAAARTALREARAARSGPLVVLLGRPSVAESGSSIAAAAGEVIGAVPEATFLVAARRGNVRGALDLGLAPGLLPGRVRLDDGREWYSAAWPAVPAARGLDATGILTAAAEGRLHALVLLGCDPLSDFPDRELARRALSSVSVLVAVDTFLTESAALASVVLPAASYAERPGTTTNLEGRITRLGQKVVARGTAWADWMIAVELAAALDADLGLESLEGIWDEIERLSPAHAGLTRALLQAPGRSDGVVVPLGDDPAAGAATLAEVFELDPTAAQPPATVVDGASSSVGLRIKGGLTVTPVVLRAEGTTAVTVVPGPAGPEEEVEAATGPVGPAGPEEAGAPGGDGSAPEGDGGAPGGDGSAPDGEGSAAEDSGTAGKPACLQWTPAAVDYEAPPLDAYSLRLVATRTLYDKAVGVQRSPSLAGLMPRAGVRLHPVEMERLGVASGERVRVASTRGTLVLEATADAGVPKGSAAIVFNLAGPGAGDLIDATQPVTDVRVETT